MAFFTHFIGIKLGLEVLLHVNKLLSKNLWLFEYLPRIFARIFVRIFAKNICVNICQEYLWEYLQRIFAKNICENICQEYLSKIFVKIFTKVQSRVLSHESPSTRPYNRQTGKIVWMKNLQNSSWKYILRWCFKSFQRKMLTSIFLQIFSLAFWIL